MIRKGVPDRTAGPFVADALRQLAGELLHFQHGRTGAHARRGLPKDFHGRDAVVAFQTRWGVLPVRRSERGEGNHFALAVAEEPFFHVFRNHTERRVALHVHLFDAALVEEVVRVGAAPDGRERRVDVGQAQAERARLLTVDVDAQLRLVFLPVGTHGHQILVLGGHAEKLVTGLQKRLMPEAGLVLQLEVETGRVAEFHNGGGANANTCALRIFENAAMARLDTASTLRDGS